MKAKQIRRTLSIVRQAARLRNPSRPAVHVRPHGKAGHMTAGDLCPSRKNALACRGPSTHEAVSVKEHWAVPCSGMIDLLNVADGAYRVFALWALESLCFIAWLFRLNAGKLHLFVPHLGQGGRTIESE
jgi:hypothetical protein